MLILFVILFLFGLGIFLKRLNTDYNILALCSRLKTTDGSKLTDKVYIVPGQTIFGNNLDVLGYNPEQIFNWCRELYRRANGKPYNLNFYKACIYSITRAEDVQEVLKSQTLITKSVIYELVRPFLGEGLLISTESTWHERRKLLTPAFHFNILQGFIEVFKNESFKLIQDLQIENKDVVALNDVIPQFTLNNVCETALGVKLDDIPGSREYRQAIHNLELVMVRRLCNPLMYYNIIFYFSSDYKVHNRDLKVAHDFCSQVIQKKRLEFQSCHSANAADDAIGQRKRYAMLDTLFLAEAKGIIDHQGICDEVNTFMFEGYDTTSTCLIFALLNLAVHQDIQARCYREVENFDLATCGIFDFNQLEYLERVIKETLRLYPSVPFIGRHCTQETVINGLVLPVGAEVNIHIFDIMRDERHFPDPLKFDPDRFLPENTLNMHPFAFVPFSAGSRNCIGQKFAMLEIKAMLLGILQNFRLLAVTKLDELCFENGLILRTKEKVKVKLVKRNA